MYAAYTRTLYEESTIRDCRLFNNFIQQNMVTLAVLLAASLGAPGAAPAATSYCDETPAIASAKASGYDVDGHPSLFIGIAAYRDPICRSTILDALGTARHPERIVIGVVQQIDAAAGDNPCILPVETQQSEALSLDECVARSVSMSTAYGLLGVYRPSTEAARDAAGELDRRRSEATLLCTHRSRIRLLDVAARDASGPTTARHLHDTQLYDGESFALQIDAHMRFVWGWDEILIAQWRSAGNEFAVLTAYPTMVGGGKAGPSSIREANGGAHSTVITFPCICGSKPVEEDLIFRQDTATELSQTVAVQELLVTEHCAALPAGDFHLADCFAALSALAPGRKSILDEMRPVPSLAFAAGMAFSRGHRVARVPNNGRPFLFHGEEYDMSMRLWTSGYDAYAPMHSTMFHFYPHGAFIRCPLSFSPSYRVPVRPSALLLPRGAADQRAPPPAHALTRTHARTTHAAAALSRLPLHRARQRTHFATSARLPRLRAPRAPRRCVRRSGRAEGSGRHAARGCAARDEELQRGAGSQASVPRSRCVEHLRNGRGRRVTPSGRIEGGAAVGAGCAAVAAECGGQPGGDSVGSGRKCARRESARG